MVSAQGMLVKWICNLLNVYLTSNVFLKKKIEALYQHLFNLSQWIVRLWRNYLRSLFHSCISFCGQPWMKSRLSLFPFHLFHCCGCTCYTLVTCLGVCQATAVTFILIWSFSWVEIRYDMAYRYQEQALKEYFDWAGFLLQTQLSGGCNYWIKWESCRKEHLSCLVPMKHWIPYIQNSGLDPIRLCHKSKTLPLAQGYMPILEICPSPASEGPPTPRSRFLGEVGEI